MKQIKYYLLAGMAMMTMAFVGCTEDNTMKPYEGGSSGRSGVAPDVDEVMNALVTIPQVYDVRKDGAYYSFTYEQPIDHYHPELGTFFQRCSMKFKDWDKNVVVNSHGYSMSMEDVDLAVALDANQLNIEHRYFGNSLPESFENWRMTYLNADQQSRDIHNIVSTLKARLFKNGRWVSTGTSKDGITSALQAYYSDLNGWDDFDAHVPFCAPFMPGTTYDDGSFSCNDFMPGTYLKEVCGNGYAAGTPAAIAYERLRRIPQLVCTNAAVREKAIAAVYQSTPSYYAQVVEQYNSKSQMSTGDLTKDLAALAIFLYYEYLFTKFSYVPYYMWADVVPDLTPLENGTATEEEWNFFQNFYTMNDNQLIAYLRKRSQQEGAQAQGVTRSVSEEMWNLLLLRREDKTAAYKVQAFKELGFYAVDFTIVDGTGYLTSVDCMRVNYMFTNQHAFQEAGAAGIYKQDKGKLMKDFRSWTETEKTQPIIFVYAYNDPWTGAGITDAAAKNNPMIEKVVDLIAVHNDYFMRRQSYEKSTEDAILSALEKFLK